MAINKTTITPLEFYRFMAAGALKNGLNLKARGQTVLNLARFAISSPQVSQALWTVLLDIKPAEFAKQVLFPSSLLQKPEIVSKAGKVPVERLLTEVKTTRGPEVLLDLGKLDPLVRMIGPAGVKEEEIDNLSILLDLRRSYFRYYEFDLRKGQARKTGDEIKNELFQFNIEELRRSCSWLIDRLGTVNKPYRAQISSHLNDAVRLHDANKRGAAVVCLRVAWEKLEKAVEDIETERLAKRENNRNVRQSNLIERSIGSLRLSDYGIKKLSDGTWTVPQKGYRKYGETFVKEKLSPKVNGDDVLRRTQHIVDNIAAEVEKNLENIRQLKNAASILDEHLKNLAGDPDYRVGRGEQDSIRSMIASPLDRLTKAIKRKKQEAFNRLEITVGLINSSLLKQAASMIRMAADDLEDRNIELAGQKAWFSKLGKVETKEISRAIRREESIKADIKYLVRLFATFQIKHSHRMRGTAEKLIENKLISTLAAEPLAGASSAQKAALEAVKALRQAANWSDRKPGWIKFQRVPADKLNEIADNNTRHNVIKAAKWLIIARWCLEQKYEGELDTKALANIWKALAEQNKAAIEAIEKIQ